MSKVLQPNISFNEFLTKKQTVLPLSIDIESINESEVIVPDFIENLQGLTSLSFHISNIERSIKEYKGFLALLNIVKATNVFEYSNVFVEIEYQSTKEKEIVAFYEQLNLWNIKVIIKPKLGEEEAYTNFIGAFLNKTLNKETFVSMEPIETLIQEATTKIYSKLQGRDVPFETSEIINVLIKEKINYNELKNNVLALFSEEQSKNIEILINSLLKTLIDSVESDSQIIQKENQFSEN
jgi:hypothetical protein